MARLCRSCNQPTKKSFALYCSEPCHIKYSTTQRSLKRRQARQGRTCKHCQAPISDDKQRGTMFCDRACKHNAHEAELRITPSLVNKTYKAGWYKANREEINKKVRAKAATFRMLIAAIKQQPCEDCHQCFPPVCMDFDHRDPKEKDFCIGHMKAGSFRTFVLELQKCDLVCSNCHRIRTKRRREEAANG